MPVIPTRRISSSEDDLGHIMSHVMYGSAPTESFMNKFFDNEARSKAAHNINNNNKKTGHQKQSKQKALLDELIVSTLSTTGKSGNNINSLTDFDFLRLTYGDINGIARHKNIPGRHAKQFMKRGLQLSVASLTLGPRSDLPEVSKVAEVGNPDVDVKPVISTLHVVPWAGNERQLAGSVLCEVEGQHAQICPRYIARQQLEKLSSMGYNMMGAIEFEFQVLEADSLKPVFRQRDAFSSVAMAPLEALLSDIDRHLYEAGVDTETFQTEYGPGQIEISMRPTYNIKVADSGFIFKNAIKEIHEQNDYLATFMSRPFERDIMNGMHFNHSIWDNNGRNPMWNPKQPDNLSDFARYWIGGLMKHGRAMTALCCPTVNCYRRMGRPCCPSNVTWKLNSRKCLVRVKNSSEQGTYIENRLPSGACNPYLALAATIAAGIDGVKNKIEPPEEGHKDPEAVPMSLGEALRALKQDEDFVELLGEDFVDWFCRIKQETEIQMLTNSNYDLERDLYMKLI